MSIIELPPDMFLDNSYATEVTVPCLSGCGVFYSVLVIFMTPLIYVHLSTRQFILNLLSDGPLPSHTVERKVEEAGLSLNIARNLKEELKIESIKPGGIWHWKLPDDEEQMEFDF